MVLQVEPDKSNGAYVAAVFFSLIGMAVIYFVFDAGRRYRRAGGEGGLHPAPGFGATVAIAIFFLFLPSVALAVASEDVATTLARYWTAMALAYGAMWLLARAVVRDDDAAGRQADIDRVRRREAVAIDGAALAGVAARGPYLFFAVMSFLGAGMTVIATLVGFAMGNLDSGGAIFPAVIFVIALSMGWLFLRAGKKAGQRITSRVQAASAAPSRRATVPASRAVPGVHITPAVAGGMRQIASTSKLRVLGFAATGFACLVMATVFYTAYSNAQAARWPTTPARVLENTRYATTEYDTHKKKNVTVYRRRVRFGYKVQGVDYQATQTFRADDPESFTPGMTYAIHYDPADPNVMVLYIASPQTLVIVGVIFGGIILAVGQFFFWRARVLLRDQ